MAPPSAIDVEAVTDTTGVTFPDPFKLPLKVNEIYGRRKKSGKAQWGTAAPSNSDQFKWDAGQKKNKAKRWDRKRTTQVTVFGPRAKALYRSHER